jgi:predicted nucleic acid-binding protein
MELFDELDLGRGPLLLDANCLVYLIEGDGERRERVELFLEGAGRAGLVATVSAIAWAELLEAPLRRGDGALAARYRRLLADSERIRVEPVDAAIAEEAARLGAGSGLALGDALHLATALVLGARAVLSNDAAWPGALEAVLAKEAKRPLVLLVDELFVDEEGELRTLRSQRRRRGQGRAGAR